MTQQFVVLWWPSEPSDSHDQVVGPFATCRAAHTWADAVMKNDPLPRKLGIYELQKPEPAPADAA